MVLEQPVGAPAVLGPPASPKKKGHAVTSSSPKKASKDDEIPGGSFPNLTIPKSFTPSPAKPEATDPTPEKASSFKMPKAVGALREKLGEIKRLRGNLGVAREMR